MIPGLDDQWAKENAFQAMAMLVLADAGAVAWDTSGLANGVAGWTQSGAPDIIGFLRGGRGVALELKAQGGKLSAPQRKRGEQIEAQGSRYRVCYTLREVLAGFDLG